MIPESNDGRKCVDPLTKTETSGDTAELGHMNGFLWNFAERSETCDLLFSNRKRRLGVTVGGAISRVNKLNNEIGPDTRTWSGDSSRRSPIAPVIWREIIVRVVVVILSRTVIERRRRAHRDKVTAIYRRWGGRRRRLTISRRSSTVGRRKRVLHEVMPVFVFSNSFSERKRQKLKRFSSLCLRKTLYNFFFFVLLFSYSTLSSFYYFNHIK